MPKFVPRERKHKLRRKDTRDGKSGPSNDSNAPELIPGPKSEREEKRRQLKEDLRAQQPKVSSKKKKRLDKYVVRFLDFLM